MKSKKYLLALLPIFLFVLVLSGCGSATEKDSKDTLAINSGDVIATMDSSMNTDAIGAQHLTNTMEGLYRYDGKDLKPAIAKKVVKPTNGGKTYTFDLRHTKWSNGKPVTANDFVYAWRRTVDPKTASQYAYIYTGIKNADKINAGKKPVNTLGIKALGKYKLEVTLENAIPYFNTLMASSTFYPQYKPSVEKAGKQYGLSSTGMVFNGPFKLVNWNVSKNSWTEVKNNKYWNAKSVKLKTLKYYVVKDPNTGLNLYDANRINRYEKLGGDTARQVSSYKTFSMDKQTANFYLELNQKKYKFFRNAKIRQAISMSINREQLTNNVLGKTGGIEHTIVPVGMSYNPTTKVDFTKEKMLQSSNQYTEYNPKEATKLWKEGIKETGQKNLSFTLLGDDTDNSKKQNEYLQGQMEKNLPGIKITLSNVPFKSRLDKSTSGNFDIVVTGWNADYPDPVTFLDIFTTGNVQNNGKYSNAQYDALINKSKTTDATNEDARWQDLLQATKILTDDQGAIPLYQSYQANLTRSNVKGYRITPNGSYNLVTAYKK
ncbi:peptide ABC transporter substrate-binding protein [Companilactobacillus kimchii]|uniref:Oligopeptide ABC transporter, substrate-binding lipoprotein n=2 Tax=Companilactobacillus kimchii TaxID=2801452 RepID=A0ABR5NVE9_9LACO|nr:peptide ABC transporter substrate-binding protein [Companilactobacillus kimchii]KAE9558177.1 peptide ABC transporter substrate-binding protein [Companilactobacillus kimchii]KRK52788.1 oligopeptide ABC transporter, substrate-binding lipoprotein precursor [Companilactobacillus kimchii DSM 13961 = JCM 10707]OWF32914.1 Dipeptide-binding protein DppE [Companilactobacillus kimchii]GEO46872.1 peptide ABC transporter substrate-binding protein [Companilactobacillus paralimentarius]